jgi:hypothetical protein
MKLSDIAPYLALKLLTKAEAALDNEVTGCYIGDLLSWVMSRCQPGDAWLTVMGNLNSVAVASLADAACVILCENAALDEDAKKKASSLGIPYYSTEKNSYETAVLLAQLLETENEASL